MPSIERNNFPVHAKSLGRQLLGYTLHLPEAGIENLMQNGGDLDAARFDALQTLDKLVLDVKQQRIHNHSLDWHDLMFIKGIRYQDGTIPFNKMRKEFGGSVQTLASSDPVVKALLEMCVDCYPYALVNSSSGPGPFGRMELPHFSVQPIGNQFCAAVLQDEALLKLFHTVGPDNLTTVGNAYSCYGTGGSFQLCLLADHLLQTAFTYMQMTKQSSIENYQKSMMELVSALRIAASGETASLKAACIFDGVGLPPDARIKTQYGILSNITEDAYSIIPGPARPGKNSNGDIAGCMLMMDVDYTLFVSKSDPGWPPYTERPIESFQKTLIAAQNSISLITSLSFDEDPPVAARYRSVIVVDPCIPAGHNWKGFEHSHRGTIIATKQHCSELTKWAKLVETADDQKVEIAINRFLEAITERPSLEDSLVDAVIGLENLFGTKTEIAFSIASVASRLLGKTEKDRSDIFDQAKKIYSARSNLVHGNKKISEEELLDLRNKAINLLSNCLRKLYQYHPKLLEKTSSDRVKDIVLMD